jgi:hypothetical protein
MYTEYPSVVRSFIKQVVEVEEELELQGVSDYRQTIKTLEERGNQMTSKQKQLVHELYDFRTEYFMLTGLAK